MQGVRRAEKIGKDLYRLFPDDAAVAEHMREVRARNKRQGKRARG